MHKVRGVFGGSLGAVVCLAAVMALFAGGCEKAAVDETPVVRPVRFFEVGASEGTELRMYPGVVEAGARPLPRRCCGGHPTGLPIAPDSGRAAAAAARDPPVDCERGGCPVRRASRTGQPALSP